MVYYTMLYRWFLIMKIIMIIWTMIINIIKPLLNWYSPCKSFIYIYIQIHMGMDQYLLLSILMGWTSINPSYFDVNYRGTRFWHTAIFNHIYLYIYIYLYIPMNSCDKEHNPMVRWKKKNAALRSVPQRCRWQRPPRRSHRRAPSEAMVFSLGELVIAGL